MSDETPMDIHILRCTCSGPCSPPCGCGSELGTTAFPMGTAPPASALVGQLCDACAPIHRKNMDALAAKGATS